MAVISKVVVNHEEHNYFNDYDEIRTDRMTSITDEKIAKAINKLVNRFKTRGHKDHMFVCYDDDTAYRLGYQTVDMESYEHPTYGTMYRGGREALVLRHYTHASVDSWDTDREVTVAQAKRLILGREQQ